MAKQNLSSDLGFDVAAGLSEATLNGLLSQVYNAVYPNILKGSIGVNEVNISVVDFDIQAAPKVTLQPSQEAKSNISAYLESFLSDHQANHQDLQAKGSKKGKKGSLTATDKSTLLAVASAATFTATAPKIALTLHYKGGGAPTTIPSASLTAYATVSVNGSDLTFMILSGALTVPGNPAMSEILNKSVLPYFINYLNTSFLGPIKIPTLGYKSLTFSAPLPVVQESCIVVFSRLGSNPATIPDTMLWNTTSVFIAADIATFEAAAGLIFPLGPQDNFSWDIISGHVGATVNKPTFSISNNGGISATIQANASAQLTLHKDWFIPDVSFGPSATATVSVGILPSIQNNELIFHFGSIPSFSFSFNWGIPSFINWLFKPLEDGLAHALNAILGPLISDALKALPGVPILSVPDIPIDFGNGIKIAISINQAVPSGYQNALLIVTAKPSVSMQAVIL